MARDNKSLGKFQLTGIPPAPRGVPQIEVAFDIDANGILKISARDKGTGREQSIQITNTGGLSESEIERMRQEASIFADEDVRRKQVVELKNQADSLFYSYESTIRDNGALISDDVKTQAKERAVELQAALADRSISVEEMKQRLDTFQQTLFAIGAAVYEQAASSDDTQDYSFTEGDSTSDGSGKVQSAQDEDEGFNFEDDDTVAADYEAID